MGFAFWKSYAGINVGRADQAAVQAIAQYDPKGLSAAQLDMDEKSIDKLAAQVADFQSQHDKAETAYNAAQALNAQRMKAAEVLQGKIDASTDDGEKAKLNASLEKLVLLMESAQGELAELKADADSTLEDLNAQRQTLEQAGARLKNRKAELEKAQRSMARAEGERRRADMAVDAARESAGLEAGSNSLNVAVNAMNARAEKIRQQAQAQKLKAETLGKTDVEAEDPHIAEAMAEASGADPDHTLSMTDRLAALKAKMPGDTAKAA